MQQFEVPSENLLKKERYQRFKKFDKTFNCHSILVQSFMHGLYGTVKFVDINK